VQSRVRGAAMCAAPRLERRDSAISRRVSGGGFQIVTERNVKMGKGRMPRSTVAAAALCSVLALSGCSGQASRGSAGPGAAPRPAASRPAVSGTPLRPRSLAFAQDRLHNCGTLAMLISWASAHPRESARLVWRQPDGGWLVAFRGAPVVTVTAADLDAARKGGLVRTEHGDEWARVVLTAFIKLRSGPGQLDLTSTDWIYAGEIASCLTGRPTSVFEIKPEVQDPSGRIRVGTAVPLAALKEQLRALRGKPVVAYTNRRIHIWSVLDYDAGRSRVLVRNPRRAAGQWMPVSQFRTRFQILVYAQ